MILYFSTRNTLDSKIHDSSEESKISKESSDQNTTLTLFVIAMMGFSQP